LNLRRNYLPYKFSILILATLLIPFIAIAQRIASIPKSATILEERRVTATRKLVLWMPNPTKHPFEMGPDDIYTCPDETLGSHYTGAAKVTLVDLTTNRPINTLEISGFDIDGPNPEIDIPYLIRRGYYYAVPNGSSKIERKPEIMRLKDYNGDGRILEFALFDKQACTDLSTTLIGYSELRDRVIQYPITTTAPEGVFTNYWFDYLFSKKPISSGHWKYEIDYRGRGGTLDKFEVRYNKKKEAFVATITRQQ
jgi:hypothetical protein